ncbi:MAG TPA: hypothetical protein VL859_01475 [Flavobacterium sp.]|nr:hypothetical protein [Flavobacterium sp.]
MLKKIIKLCTDLNNLKSKNFEGIGLIVYKNFENLPVTSMNVNEINFILPIINYDDILKKLIEISSSESKIQDGFHLLSNEFKLTHVSQYFSTPIMKEIIVENNYGSRYRTALYGSLLPSVSFTAVMSKNYGLIVFKKGIEVYKEDLI